MKKIKLTRGKFALVDDEDFDYLNQWKWNAMPDKDNWYATRTDRIDGKKTIRMHRQLMQAEKGVPCDHIDRNGLNNQRSNLRLCSITENNQNRAKRNSIVSSEYKGISWHSRIKKWQASLGYKGKKVHIGYFLNEKEAALAHDKKAKELHGEFAYCNFTN